MVMSRQNFLTLMVEGLRKVFFDQYGRYPSKIDQIYDVQKSRKRREDYQSITGIGMADEKPEGTDLTYAEMVEGYEKQFTHTAWAKGLRITRELQDDELYGVIGRRTKALARSISYRREYEAAKLFNNAAATTYYTGGDGLALLSDSHTLAGVQGTTFDNQVASTALSQTALETAFNLMRRFVDDNNLLIMLEPATLLIPPELEWDAAEILQSTGKSGTADNDMNAMRGRLKVITWPFLTGTTDWFVLCPKSDIAPLWFNRNAVEFEKDSDFDSKDLLVSAYARWSNGFNDPRFVVGRQG